MRKVHFALGVTLLALAPGCDNGESAAPEPGPSPLRRLNRYEYDNTVRDLLGDTTAPANAFSRDVYDLGFDNQAAVQSVDDALAEQYLFAAERLAADALARRPDLVPCDPASLGEDACAQSFIETFGKRAYRRPLAPDETDRLLGVFAWGRDQGGFDNGVRLVLETMLQSPRFLYRVETGVPVESEVVPLDGYEIASRLSYLIWGSMPDEALMAAADAGALATKEEIGAQARRMLADARARDVVKRFHRMWLGLEELDLLEKDPVAYPDYHAGLPALWQTETEVFVEHVVFDGAGDLTTLLTAPFTFMNEELAAFYGAPGVSGAYFVKVPLDATRHAGLLTQASAMAVYANPDQTNPVKRGAFVRSHLMCEILLPPPSELMIQPPEVDPALPTRERFDQHRTDPLCMNCHQLMDPIGYGFESFDGIGRWRSEEAGQPIDDTGEIIAARDAALEGPFDGATALARKLAASQEVRDCMVTQWFRYAHGRAVSDEDAGTSTMLRDAFAAAGGNILELIVALTQTDAFRYRHATGGSP